MKDRIWRTARGIRSFGSFHGYMLTSAFGASIAASMATLNGCPGMSSGRISTGVLHVRTGRQQIRAIVTGLQESRATSKAKGTPTVALYHVISNTAIEVVSASQGRHHSYWQTVRVGANNQITIGAIGKRPLSSSRNGRIQHRRRDERQHERLQHATSKRQYY